MSLSTLSILGLILNAIGAGIMDGGMLLLRQIDEGLGISRSLARCFYDARNPLFIEHSVRELVAQRLLGMAAGYEDLNDHNLLRLDPLFAVAVGKEDPLGSGRAPQDQGKALASASTLNRLELGNNKKSRRRQRKLSQLGSDELSQ
jgi:hypothetical protein